MCSFTDKECAEIYVTDKTAKNLCNNFKGLQIADTYSSPFGVEKDEKELTKINNLIKDVFP